jgi:NAD(P)-dependent dehydrogenase (short-subunit alcohol dehydrogenase family)
MYGGSWRPRSRPMAAWTAPSTTRVTWAASPPVTGQSLTELQATLDVNVRGTLLCLRYELTVMLAAGHGAIVNNASLAGLVGSPENAIYDASKHAVVGLTSPPLSRWQGRAYASTPSALPAWRP